MGLEIIRSNSLNLASHGVAHNPTTSIWNSSRSENLEMVSRLTSCTNIALKNDKQENLRIINGGLKNNKVQAADSMYSGLQSFLNVHVYDM